MRLSSAVEVDELKALAHDRLLETEELHTPNDFYGHATVLKSFAGYAQEYQLKTVVEHGASPSKEIWGPDLNASLPVVLTASDYRHALWRKHAKIAGFRNRTYSEACPSSQRNQRGSRRS